jgi:excisionase family DNA binding protein
VVEISAHTTRHCDEREIDMMAQRFVSLEEAANELGISKDRLNELREDGRVRAYRDGTSWKFRAEDIEKLAAEGISGGDPGASDISLDLDVEEPSTPEPTSGIALDVEEEPLAEPAGISDLGLDLGDDKPMEKSPGISDLGLDLGDEEPAVGAGMSDISLDDVDDATVPVDPATDSDEMLLDDNDDIDDMSDSILLSEAELGESTDRPPSTIIGKAEMAAELDLDLGGKNDPSTSDVKLAPSTSNVFSPPEVEDVLDIEPPSLSDNFGDLEELEIDLEAESSRILAPEDVAKAQQAAKQNLAAEISDLELAPSDSNLPGGGSKNALDSIIGGGSDLAGLSALELDSDDDDEVLGEGSDITLSSESSGINIISPSDSGLALDELAAGSMGSPLDLGAVEPEVGLEPLEVDEETAEAKGEEPFALTPFGEEAADDEEDSSQVIPLDEVSEDEGGAALGLGVSSTEGMGDEFGAASFGAVPVGEPAVETPFSTANVVGLVLCVIPLMLVGMMMFDLLRNIWSWDQVYTLNSSLLEMLNPFIG